MVERCTLRPTIQFFMPYYKSLSRVLLPQLERHMRQRERKRIKSKRPAPCEMKNDYCMTAMYSLLIKCLTLI